MSHQRKLIAKRIVCAVLSIAAIALLLAQAARLRRCDGLLALQWQADAPGTDIVETQLTENTLVLASAVFRLGSAGARTEMNRYIACTTYTTDTDFAQAAGLPMASGRFFLPADYAEEQLVVLGYDTAVTLFSGKDCLGGTVLLDNVPHTVIGVAAEQSFGIENLARVENAAVYLLDGGGAVEGAQMFAYARTVTAAADLLEHSLSALRSGGNRLTVHNLSQAAGLTYTVAHLFVMVWLAVLSFHLAKALSARFQYPKARPRASLYRKQRKTFRLLEIWRNAPVSDRRRILFWGVWAAGIALTYLVASAGLGFRLVIPGGWLNGEGGLTGYFINLNTNPTPALYLAQINGYALAAIAVLGILAMVLLDKAVPHVDEEEE